MIRFKRTKSLCKECPLRGEKKVWSLCEVDKPRVALLGEAPGAHEAEEGKPFVGPAGKWLKAAIGKTGMLFHSLYRMNVISCRPPRNDIGSFEALEALRCCTPGFLEELSYMEKLGIRVIVPLGNTATGALDLEGNISKIRGSVYVRQNGKQTTVVIPTFHPSFIMRGMLKEEGTWIADLTKARDLSIKKYVPPKEIFTTNPTLKDLQAFHKMCMEKKPLLGVDIETTALSPYYARIVVVGFALDGERAFSYPLLKQGGKPYWNGSTAKAEKYLKDILKKCPTMYQNALFDVRHLEEKGYEVGNIHDDVLLIHAAIHPELPHNLGYITSIYGTTPYWKGEFSQRAGSILEMEDETLRVYNLRDAAVLQQVRPDLLSDLKETGTESIYRNISLPLIRPILQMEKNGIGFSERKQAAFRKSLEKKAAHLTKDLYSLLQLPASFNFSSSDHMRAFLYGDTPTSYKRAKEELKKYDENPKLRKDTKKYANLVEIVSTFSEVTPLIKLPRTTKTEGGDGATDKEAFISIQRMVVNRRDAVQNLKRPTPAHADELERLNKFLVFIEKFRELKKIEKLLSTYTNFPVGPDGRVHGEYMIHGTRTGRLSSRSPNMQNLSKEVKNLFFAEEGNYLIQGDYSNLELRVLAYVAEDDVLMDIFDKGGNVHDINCKLLFEIDETHPMWKAARKASKIYIFGRNYGGSLNGVYQQVLKEVPDMPLTYQQFCAVDSKYRMAHPKYATWYDKTVEEVTRTRVLTTPFGRKRIFLGQEHEITREGLNTQIQSPAADIANLSLIALEKESRKGLFKMCGTVHDSILVETKKENLHKVVAIMKKCMEHKVTINGKMATFPVDFEYGENWGALKAYEKKEK